MTMVKKSISVTGKQNDWIRAQIESGLFGNESEVVRDLIRERQLKEQERPEQIASIRAKLIEAEKSGFTDQSTDEIWDEARQEQKSNG